MNKKISDLINELVENIKIYGDCEITNITLRGGYGAVLYLDNNEEIILNERCI